MSDTAGARPALGVTTILGDSFSLVFRNLVPMMILAGVPAVIGVVLNLIFVGIAAQNIALALSNPELYAATAQTSVLVTIIMTIVGILLFGLAIAAVTAGAYRAAEGAPISLNRALGIAVSCLLMVILCMVITGIAVYIGLILLILPGLYLMGLWFVLIPAIVVERKGLGAIGRSAELTKGYRWPLVGLVVLFLLIVIGLSIITGGAQFVGFGLGTVGLILANVVGVVVAAFYYALAGAMGALTCARLVEIKEGTGMSTLAEVFS
ncbi:MAG: hypothetical protein AAF674_05490 [Pseudomonadota bacterium]